jgi:LmbE family N-acetylglucosaminyl deacetylase
MIDKRSLLVILAHPDDESFPMGGTLAKYAAQGVSVTLVCATRGEAGIPGFSPLEAGKIRERELRAAAKTLGIHAVHFLNYLDGELTRANPETLVSQLMLIMRQVRPEVVVTFGPDGISGHLDHVAISRFTSQAFDSALQSGILPLTSRLYYLAPSEATLQGCGVTPSREIGGGPVAAIDVADYLVTKVKAMQAHASQEPPYPGEPEVEAARLACHEHFALAYPTVVPGNITDLFGDGASAPRPGRVYRVAMA